VRPPTASGPRAGVYVHFPWCLAKCPYCDFVSYVEPSIDHAGYASAVLRELCARAPLLAGRRVESVFFGGGTPSLWDTRELERVLSAVRTLFDVSVDLEVTVECNPTSLDLDKARDLRAAGVNRLSIGVQSLDGERLRFLGRLHDGRGAIEAIDGALASGIERVSADLIFGLPGQTPDAARAEARTLAEMGLRHLSCYQLTIEPQTRFGELAKRGRLPLADEGAVAEAFIAIDETLSALGLRHYEISNYASAGEEARHNLGYWRGDEYLGVGCAAYGFVMGARRPDARGVFPGANGVRWRNAVRADRYVAKTSTVVAGAVGDDDGLSESTECVAGPALMRERIMLGLRVAHGVDLDALSVALDTPGWTPARERAAAWLAERGRIVRTGPRVSIPTSAWLWADDTCARLF